MRYVSQDLNRQSEGRKGGRGGDRLHRIYEATGYSRIGGKNSPS
jgi:hypothetical protein